MTRWLRDQSRSNADLFPCAQLNAWPVTQQAAYTEQCVMGIQPVRAKARRKLKCMSLRLAFYIRIELDRSNVNGRHFQVRTDKVLCFQALCGFADVKQRLKKYGLFKPTYEGAVPGNLWAAPPVILLCSPAQSTGQSHRRIDRYSLRSIMILPFCFTSSFYRPGPFFDRLLFR